MQAINIAYVAANAVPLCTVHPARAKENDLKFSQVVFKHCLSMARPCMYIGFCIHTEHVQLHHILHLSGNKFERKLQLS
jgi:hypothetical protein